MSTISVHLMERLLSICGTPEDRDALIQAIETGGGDLTANEIAYNHVASGLTSVDVQAAIDELAARGGGGGAGTVTANLFNGQTIAADVGTVVIDSSTTAAIDMDYIIKRKYNNVVNSGGTFDTAYQTNSPVISGGASRVNAIAICPNTNTQLNVGLFTTVSGNAISNLYLTNADGTFSTDSLNIGTGANGEVLSVTTDGNNFFIGGAFTAISGTTLNHFASLFGNGQLNPTFNTALGTGFNGNVLAIKSQSDGKILVGGLFTTLNGVSHNRLVRLNTDGTLDTTFATNVGTGPDAQVNTIEVSPDGRIFVGGRFSNWNGTSYINLICLNSDGTLNTAFNSNLGSGLNNPVYSIAYDVNLSKVVIYGNFSVINGVTRQVLARLNDNGTLDTAFNSNIGSLFTPNTENGFLVIDANSFIYVGLNTVNPRIRCFNSNGFLDLGFKANNGTSIAGSIGYGGGTLDHNNRLYVSGSFTAANGVATHQLAAISTSFTSNPVDFYEQGRVLAYYNNENSVWVVKTVIENGATSYTTMSITAAGHLRYTNGNIVGTETLNQIKLNIKSL